VIGYALASDYPEAIERLAVTDANSSRTRPRAGDLCVSAENVFLRHFMFNHLPDLPETPMK
jgi:hypothetical protein